MNLIFCLIEHWTEITIVTMQPEKLRFNLLLFLVNPLVIRLQIFDVILEASYLRDPLHSNLILVKLLFLLVFELHGHNSLLPIFGL